MCMNICLHVWKCIGVYTIQRIQKRASDHWELELQLVSVSLWEPGTNSGSSGTKHSWPPTRLSCLEAIKYTPVSSVGQEERQLSLTLLLSSPFRGRRWQVPFRILRLLYRCCPDPPNQFALLRYCLWICYFSGHHSLFERTRSSLWSVWGQYFTDHSRGLASRQVKFYYVCHL